MVFATMPFERMMALFPPESGHTEGFLNTLTVTKVLLAALIPIWLLRILLLKDGGFLRKTFSSPSPALAILFALYTSISLINAVSLGSYLKNEFTIVSNLVLFIVVLNIFDDKKWILRSIVVLFVAYVIVGLMGVYEVETQTHILELMGHTMPEEAFVLYGEAFRPAGPSGDPDYFATSVLFGLMLTLAVWRFVRSRLLWLALIVIVGVFLFDIFATGSRGAMLAFLIAMAVFWWFLETPYKVPLAGLGIVAFLAGFTLYTVFVSGRTAGRYTGGETTSLEYRLGWQQQCFGMIAANPILGVGTGNALANEHRFFDPRPPRKPENAANTYVQLAAEAGIPSVLIFIAFFWIILLFLAKVALRCRDPEVRHLATALGAALTGFFFFAATAHALYNELTWSLLGLSVALAQSAPEKVATPG
jgi:O-antigen ligase